MIVGKTGDEYTRLHISPLRPDLLSAYLGPTLVSAARNISFHSVQTLPERGFGYVDLPSMEATKLKKKLNGSIFKGSKVSVDEARPEKRGRDADGEGRDEDEGKAKKRTRRGKRASRKERDGAIEGYELEGGRRVKRGWTETPAEKRREKETEKRSKSEKREKGKEKKVTREVSKYTSEPECLFRTNTAAKTEPVVTTHTAKKKKGKTGDMVIHEFSNTKKHPSFLRPGGILGGARATQEYVDGAGWVDAEGNVLEEETDRQREKRERRQERAANKASKATGERERTGLDEIVPQAEDQDGIPLQRESGFGSSLNDEAPSQHQSPEEPPAGVHPLEALYKRPKLANIDTTPTPRYSNFSFFESEVDDSDIERGDDEVNDVADTQPPLTPHTKRYAKWREIRSAAPTPDTAAIGKRFSFPGDIEGDSEDEQASVDRNDSAQSLTSLNRPRVDSEDHVSGYSEVEIEEQQEAEKARDESDFAKWFYEHRSENNKVWRAHRREALKMRRKRENRRLTRRLL